MQTLTHTQPAACDLTWAQGSRKLTDPGFYHLPSESPQPKPFQPESYKTLRSRRGLQKPSGGHGHRVVWRGGKERREGYITSGTANVLIMSSSLSLLTMSQVTHNLGVQAVCTSGSNLVTGMPLLRFPSCSLENPAWIASPNPSRGHPPWLFTPLLCCFLLALPSHLRTSHSCFFLLGVALCRCPVAVSCS